MEKVKETDYIIEQLLQVREMRLQQKLDMVSSGYHLVSLQLNIPGLPKSNDVLKQFINRTDEAFQYFFKSRSILCTWEERKLIDDIAGDAVIYLFDKTLISSADLKELTEEFESSYSLGRIVDLDVINSEGQAVSSGRAKACFVCSDVAEVCRKTNRHSIEQVRYAMLLAIKNDLRDTRAKALIRKVSSCAVNALLLEVSLSPKPGLVCRYSTGAHSDMDYITFLNSVSVLSPYFLEIGELAQHFKAKGVSKALSLIREVGLRMERQMLMATQGVNTHKGAIFLLAISSFAVIQTILKHGAFKCDVFMSKIQEITRGIVQHELCIANDNMKLSHGQQCFRRYGLQAAGARGEAEQGLPTVLNYALPYLNNQWSESLCTLSDAELKSVLVPVLLKIITVNSDTNVLYRHDKQVLDLLKSKAQEALNAWENGEERCYMELVRWCNERKISPGGSADLLAVTLMLHFVQTEFS